MPLFKIYRRDQRGFTLIELSIVLVIIGLIVGGIVVGRELIRVSELRSIITDWNKFETATNRFQEKYKCLPGDCAKAASLGLGTNGDGNGRVANPITNSESWQYWLHLKNADLVAGTYTGSAGTDSAYDANIGVNVPSSRMNGIGYSIYTDSPNPYWGINNTLHSHYIATGSDGGNQTLRGSFKRYETQDIDTKIDDGLPNNGRVRTHAEFAGHNVIGCTVGTVPDYNYDMTQNGICNLGYLLIR